MKITKYTGIVFAIACLFAVSFTVSAQESDNSSGAVSNGSLSGLSTNDGGDASVSNGSVSNTSTNDGGDGSVSNGSLSGLSTNDGGSGVSGDTTSSGGSNGGSNGGSSGSSNSGSSGSSSGSNSGGGNGGSSSHSSSNTTMTATSSCPLITDFLKFGGNNDGVQVSKLQAFLKNTEKADVEVSGIFDVKTFDAVKYFQKKYITSILGPWSATRATGFVYITTVKKINEISCAQALTLSADELAIINSYKNRKHSNTSTGIGSTVSGNNATGTLEVGSTDDNNNVAASAGASILGRFWAFIKNLFR